MCRKQQTSGGVAIQADKLVSMITGAHVLFYSEKPEADRVFFRDVLGFRAVDAGGGWLIFALPPAEAGIHPTEGDGREQVHGGRSLLGAVVYLMCDDLQAEMESLKSKNVSCSPVEEANWEKRLLCGCRAEVKSVSTSPLTQRPSISTSRRAKRPSSR
jgi:hypothetical protein